MIKSHSHLFLVVFIFCISLFLYGKTGYDIFYAESEIPRIDCTSYSPYVTDINDYVDPSEIRSALEIIKKYTSCVRIYTAKNGLDKVPEIAQSLGISVVLGAWIDKVSLVENQKEIDKVIQLANTYTNVKMLVIGNEVSISDWSRIDKLTYVKYLKYVRSKTKVPIAITGLTKDLLNQYNLYEYVDIIGLHIFPYWQNANSMTDGVTLTIDEINKMRIFIQKDLKLKKEIYVLEYGQPWIGLTKNQNVSSITHQREYVKQVSKKLSEYGIFSNYYELISEKRINSFDGYVYRLWGLLTHEGKNIVDVQKKIYIKILIALILVFITLFILSIRIKIVKKLEYATYLMSLCLISGYNIYVIRSIYRTDFLYIQIPVYLLMFLSFAVYLKVIIEFHVLPEKNDLINSGTKKINLNYFSKKVSIVIPSRSEDLDMVTSTIQSCLNQTYKDIEIIFINNGYQTNSYKNDIKKLFESYNDSRLKYHYYENFNKNKSSVLNYGLQYISSDTTHILFLDADYVINKDAVEVGLINFLNPNVSVVQYPQTYESTNKYIGEMARMEQEYVACLSQPFRNMTNSIILNGTLCFFKYDIFKKYKWDESTVCEDAMLGSEIQIGGNEIIYINEIIGKGIAPRNFKELIIQRFRWAAGSVQVMKRQLFSKNIYKAPKIIMQYFWGWSPWTILLPLSFYTLWYTYFFYNVKNYHHPYLATLPINYIIFYTLVFLFVYGFLKTNLIKKLPFLTYLKFILFQLALINTITIGMIYGLFVKKINFIGTRSETNIKFYAWLIPLTISLIFINMLSQLYIPIVQMNNFNILLNTVFPVLLILITQIAQVVVYLIDKYQK
ncbi:glycosyltransferase [Arenimonas sp.]|nr:glycosyltransferase [Candidatus Parcubacteria bacterium]